MSRLHIHSIDTSGTYDDIVSESGPGMRAIANELRDLIAGICPGVTEVAWNKQRIASYGIGPKKMSEHFCYLAPAKSHVTLGFYHGTALADPQGLLEGDGKRLRHVKIRSKRETRSPALRKLLKDALENLMAPALE